MKVFSKIPNLLVTCPYVQFVDGVAEVNKRIGVRLSRMAWAGISVETEESAEAAETEEAAS